MFRGFPSPFSTFAILFLMAFAAPAVAQCPNSPLFTSGTGGTNGWTLVNATTVSLPGSKWVINPGNDPRVMSPTLSCAASSYNYMRLGLNNHGTDTNGRVYFDNGSGFAESRSVGFTNPSNPSRDQWITVRLDNISGWSGTIRQLRVDPVANGSGGSDNVDLLYFYWRKDTKAPVFRGSAVVVSPATWTNGPITVTMYGQDPAEVNPVGPDVYGGGCIGFNIRVDTGSWTFVPRTSFDDFNGNAGAVYTFPAGSLSSGSHTLSVQAVDLVNHVSATTETRMLYYDATAPNPPGTPTASPPGWTNNNYYTFSWAPGSDGQSGVAGYNIYVNGNLVNWVTGTSTAGAYAQTEGPNTFGVQTEDNLGYASAIKSVGFYLDLSDPGTPTILNVTPADWTKTDGFAATWNNPGDTWSGINRYQWSIDGGTPVNAAGTSVGGVHVTTPGVHAFAVRAVDNAGNVGDWSDPEPMAYDPDPPSPPVSLQVQPATYTNVNEFAFVWDDGSDALSGTAGFDYRVNGGGINPIEALGVQGALATTSGPNTFEVRARDAAGNMSDWAQITFYYSPGFIPPPSLLAPAGGDSVALPVTFGWAPPTGTSGYEVQIATDAAFMSGLWTTTSDIASTPIPVAAAPTVGQQYFWRVRPVGSVPAENWSATETFVTAEAPPPLPEQVIGLEFPAGDAGEGVNTSLGAVTRGFPILTLYGPGGDVIVMASYSSLDNGSSSLGPKWSWTLGQSLSLASPPFAIASIEDGQDVRFRWTGSAYETDAGVYDTLTSSGGVYEMVRPSRERLLFDSSGKLSAIHDRNGNTITLDYSGSTLTQFHDQAGRLFVVSAASGKVTEITDPLGRHWIFEYDGAGYLSAFVEPTGARTEYHYDPSGRLVRVVDARGNDALQCTYGADGRVATQTDAAGGVTAFGYDDAQHRTTVTDPLGGVTVHAKDDHSRLLFDINPRGDSTNYVYDANNNRVEVRDGRGHTTRYEYDTRGNIVRVTDPVGAQTRTVYDFNNLPVERVDALGNTTAITNDLRGNPTRVEEPLGRTTLHEYNGAGQIIQTTDANGHLTTHVYDALGNRTSTTNGAGDVTTYGYDAVGRRTSMIDGLLHTTSYVFDGADRLLSTTNALPATTLREYDANGNLTAEVDARGKRTDYAYDAKNRRIQMRDALGNVTTYAYDALDRRILMRDPRGHDETYAYDAAGNLLTTTSALGFQTSNTYDANRNRISTTDPRGKTTSYTYDPANRLVATTSPLGHVTTSAFDLMGREVSRTNARGKTTSFSYDALGRLVTVQAPNGGALAYGYDPVGNRTTRTNAKGHTTTYAYDGADRMIRMTDAVGAFETYAYDAAGNRVQSVDRNGHATTFDYDAANRMVAEHFFDGSQNLHTLDLVGNLTALADAWGIAGYSYDDVNRLTGATDHDGRVIGFGYDSTGNRTSLEYPGGQRVRYAYDADDRMVGVTDWGEKTVLYGYDAAGNNTSITHPNGISTALVYDDDERLVSLLTQTAGAETLVAVGYVLDENGNRTRMTRVDRREDPLRDDVPDPYALSALLSRRTVEEVPDSMVAVSGEQWDEALPAAALARRRGTPLLIVPGDNLLFSPAATSEVARLSAAHPGLGAIVSGEIDGVSATVEAQLGAQGIGSRRLAGADRFATAAMAADPCSLAVLLGAGDADLAGPAALLAGATGAPLLYVHRDSMPVVTENALVSLGIRAVVLVGDDGRIGPPVAGWLAGHGIVVRRRFTEDEPAALSVAMQGYLDSGRQNPDSLRLLSRDAWQDGVSSGAMCDPSTAALFVNPEDLDASPEVLRWIGLHKGRLERVRLSGSEEALSATLAGRLRTALRTTITEYAYDDLDELTSEIIPGVDTLGYAYDLLGNRASLTHNGITTAYTYDGNDRLSAAGAVSYAYDANGNRTLREEGAEVTHYDYDPNDRLVRVDGPGGESRYRYDGIGRRIRSEEPGLITRYVVDPTARPYETLEAREDDGTLRAALVHAAGLVSERTATGDVRFFHYDGLGSTTALTDSTGTDVGHLAFTAFGDTAMDLGATETRYGWVGRYGVEATASGLVFMRDRFYDPEIGAFLSEDPEEGGDRDALGISLYLYAAGNPVSNLDSDGRSWASVIRWTGRFASPIARAVHVPGAGVLFSVASSIAYAKPGSNPLRSAAGAVAWGVVKWGITAGASAIGTAAGGPVAGAIVGIAVSRAIQDLKPSDIIARKAPARAVGPRARARQPVRSTLRSSRTSGRRAYHPPPKRRR